MTFEVRAFISAEALKKRKDKYIREKINKYNSIILNILTTAQETGNPRNYPSELIEKFFVSPRGGAKERVAWHFSVNNNIINIYIDDILYHAGKNDYNNNWISKVRKDTINLGYYNKSGYVEYTRL